MVEDTQAAPLGDLTVRVPAMPADANAAGDIFGGWVMAQMDLAAGIKGAERAQGRVATIAVDRLVFKRPVKIGDTLSVYTTVEHVGRSSIRILVESWAQRHLTSDNVKVTEGVFTMVALDQNGLPTPVPA
ncbi:acyl-CoA thioesterase [Aureimonas fodinaquatilis]|uniref:Acyl-CoA thioesterase n=1 Tax=Aureimonas fodinaquatilis TaxID=2565783 RepID=A0A5B0E229_9HYPH|nr:acyl-CoA thioesterase [Aureimonas fodinaquatilis]KAA0971790.1 acyl-CoA thioesterase [Aureimonas fodinaquatilis]